MIVEEDIQRVRDATNLREIVSLNVQLKRVGRRWVGLCPFHAEKTGSFNVNEENGLWKCFGCGMGGDAITYVREIEHLDFAAAVEWLAAKAGITLRYTERGEDEGRKRRAVLIDAVASAVDWYHDRLVSGPDAGPARAYLRGRGFDGDLVRRYKLGWAPQDWDELARALRLPDDVLTSAGLGFINRRGRPTDAFRARVLFPIYDTNGDPVAFGGRLLPGAEQGPKYKNSPETPIYSKSKVLYGLSWAKADIVNADEAIVCEGYTDVIGFANAEIPRAVATCGTALTEEHLRLLRKFAHRVVLAFDADAAGQSAAARFYEWERKLELDVAVAALPPGVDPAELALNDPAALRKAAAEAVPFLGFRVRRVLDAANLASPEGRARAAERALEVIREHPSELVRDQYLMDVAARCRIEADQLRTRLRSPGAARVIVDVRPNPPSLRDSPELEVLRHLAHAPAGLDDLLSDPIASERLFASERNLAVFRALRSAPSVQAALGVADPGAQELILRLAVEEPYSEVEDAVARLVRESARRAVDEDKHRAENLADQMVAIERLAEPHSRRPAIEQLLTWLGSRSEDRV